MTQNTGRPRTSGNPLFPGWYADPELHFSEGQYTSSSGHHSVLKLLGTDDDWVICYHPVLWERSSPGIASPASRDWNFWMEIPSRPCGWPMRV